MNAKEAINWIELTNYIQIYVRTNGNVVVRLSQAHTNDWPKEKRFEAPSFIDAVEMAKNYKEQELAQ